MRYICGVFSRGKKDTEKLFKELNIGQGALFFQPFWIQHADGHADGGAQAREREAVAARFEMGAPKNVKLVGVYPAYLVVRGPSQDVSVPHITQQPNWLDLLFPHGSGIKKGLGRLVDVPRLPQVQSQFDLQDSLPMRQKPTPHPALEEGSSPVSSLVGACSPIKGVPEEKYRLEGLGSSKDDGQARTLKSAGVGLRLPIGWPQSRLDVELLPWPTCGPRYVGVPDRLHG